MLQVLVDEFKEQAEAKPTTSAKPTATSATPRMWTSDRRSPEYRARAYVFAPGFPDSIAGQNGHGRLYHVACVLVDGFGLTRQQAMPIFQDWNDQKAIPPESEKQSTSKPTDAINNHPVPSPAS